MAKYVPDKDLYLECMKNFQHSKLREKTILVKNEQKFDQMLQEKRNRNGIKKDVKHQVINETN